MNYKIADTTKQCKNENINTQNRHSCNYKIKKKQWFTIVNIKLYNNALLLFVFFLAVID